MLFRSTLEITYIEDSVVGFQANVSPQHLTLATPTTAPVYMTDTEGIRDVLEVIAGLTAGDLDV